MSEQGLNERDFLILGAAFEANEIGSNNGKPYVKPRALKKRLRMVDLNYKTDIDTYIQVIGDVVTVWGGLTLKGVRHAGSKSKNVNCWRKAFIDESDHSKGQHYVRVDEYEYARELAFAIMKAKSGLLQRCAETFDVGDYLKEKSSPPPPSLATVLAGFRQQQPPPSSPSNVTQLPATTPPPPEPEKETPKHWALNGDGEKIKTRMNTLGLTWDDLKSSLEPGKTLAKLSDTALTYNEVYHKMDEIKAAKVADEMEAKRQAQSSSQKGDEPFQVSGDQLQVNDLVYGLGGGKPKRLICNLGDNEDGAFTYWAVWANSDFSDSLSRMLFEKALKFKVLRTGETVAPPDKILNELEQLKREQKALREGEAATT